MKAFHYPIDFFIWNLVLIEVKGKIKMIIVFPLIKKDLVENEEIVIFIKKD